MNGNSMPMTNPNDGTTSYDISSSSINSGVSPYHNGVNVQNSSIPNNISTGNSNANQQPMMSHSTTSSVMSNQPISDSYEVTLKDFNTAFRSTPYSSPVHHSGSLTDIDSNGANSESLGLSSAVSQPLSSTPLSSNVSNSLDDCRGSSSGTINWGSVLSLGSQSELDPLNKLWKQEFAVETWPTTTNCGNSHVSTSTTTSTSTSGTMTSSNSGSSCANLSLQNGINSSQSSQLIHSSSNTMNSLPPLNLSDLDISGQRFVDDIGWKLSADDVLKAFPCDEQIFVGP